MTHTPPDSGPSGPPVGAGVVPMLPVPQQLEHLFGGAYSAQWYVRRNKARLVDAGALLMHCGRWHVDLARFDTAFRELAAEAARAHLARTAA